MSNKYQPYNNFDSKLKQLMSNLKIKLVVVPQWM